jgi:hypothetical protein
MKEITLLLRVSNHVTRVHGIAKEKSRFLNFIAVRTSNIVKMNAWFDLSVGQ